jgi:hypothetical protein
MRFRSRDVRRALSLFLPAQSGSFLGFGTSCSRASTDDSESAASKRRAAQSAALALIICLLTGTDTEAWTSERKENPRRAYPRSMVTALALRRSSARRHRERTTSRDRELAEMYRELNRRGFFLRYPKGREEARMWRERIGLKDPTQGGFQEPTLKPEQIVARYGGTVVVVRGETTDGSISLGTGFFLARIIHEPEQASWISCLPEARKDRSAAL